MHFFGAGRVRGTLANNGAAANKGGTLALRGQFFGLYDGSIDSVDIVAVDIAQHVPAIAFEALGRVVAKPVFDAAVDRSEERRVGKECVRTCRSRWLP